jgi:hypothetical protein
MRRLLVAFVFALSACSGTGSTMLSPPAAPAAPQPAGSLSTLASCPPTTPGFHQAASQTCPDVVLRIVSGRTLTASDTQANVRTGTVALLFDADGNFLYAEQQVAALRLQPRYELDVLDTADVDNIAKYQWTLYHQATPPLAPFAVHLASVQQLSGDQVSLPGSVSSYLVADGAGNTLATVTDTMGFPVNFLVPAGRPHPLTLLTFTTSVPQSHCGNCWVTLQHP